LLSRRNPELTVEALLRRRQEFWRAFGSVRDADVILFPLLPCGGVLRYLTDFKSSTNNAREHPLPDAAMT
jgi:hypothetical protein